ncbi:MAG: hypothetical protein JNK93_14500 [Planctomycetia bacterium]|nr:hypothetical protein [Planctomycetia bacterium]
MTSAAMASDGVAIETTAVGPLLPKLAEACRDAGLTPTSMEVTESTLERVFLHLTGHALRD